EGAPAITTSIPRILCSPRVGTKEQESEVCPARVAVSLGLRGQNRVLIRCGSTLADFRRTRPPKLIHFSNFPAIFTIESSFTPSERQLAYRSGSGSVYYRYACHPGPS